MSREDIIDPNSERFQVVEDSRIIFLWIFLFIHLMIIYTIIKRFIRMSQSDQQHQNNQFIKRIYLIIFAASFISIFYNIARRSFRSYFSKSSFKIFEHMIFFCRLPLFFLMVSISCYEWQIICLKNKYFDDFFNCSQTQFAKYERSKKIIKTVIILINLFFFTLDIIASIIDFLGWRQYLLSIQCIVQALMVYHSGIKLINVTNRKNLHRFFYAIIISLFCRAIYNPLFNSALRDNFEFVQYMLDHLGYHKTVCFFVVFYSFFLFTFEIMPLIMFLMIVKPNIKGERNNQSSSYNDTSKQQFSVESQVITPLQTDDKNQQYITLLDHRSTQEEKQYYSFNNKKQKL